VRTPVSRPAVAFAAPVTLALAGTLLLAEAAALGTPLTRSLGTAALVMAGSTLLPVEPFDGSRLGSAAPLALTGVVAGAVLVALGLV
jgi:hypothetical protein